ncbi:hypothetical protein B0H17DRAFT_1207378 [Mycena rosella]|uniref:Chromo domain-containing protein n=1 Tax=Mycena rosella TaxID=1033263 RepID=A0AAD7D2V3_MYCRO|nr:hypothetical protein B0H17DRAFT_1207378 [Mycena rosella]
MPSEEFYVSRILEAKMVNVGSRTKLTRCWAYLTEWADYQELTWEPEENVMGSKWAVKTFWRRVASRLDGRHHTNLHKFKLGEIIALPTECVRKRKPGLKSSATGTRVFALWPETRHYYSGVVQRRVGNKYGVRFDEDDTELTVALKHMRPCAQLREDDTIILNSDTAKFPGSSLTGACELKSGSRSGTFPFQLARQYDIGHRVITIREPPAVLIWYGVKSCTGRRYRCGLTTYTSPSVSVPPEHAPGSETATPN